MRLLKLFFSLLLIALPTAPASAQSAKVFKALPQYLDLQGRHTLSPSLFERDAYQALLRKNPSQRSGLRFAIHWKASGAKEVKLRVEMRGALGKEPTKAMVEKTVTAGRTSRKWTDAALTGDDYKKFGELLAWRVTVWDGATQLAEQTSFLW